MTVKVKVKAKARVKQQEAEDIRLFHVAWDNGHASGYLYGGPYQGEKFALEVAKEWKQEMVACESTQAAKREARRAYSTELVEVRLSHYSWVLVAGDPNHRASFEKQPVYVAVSEKEGW